MNLFFCLLLSVVQAKTVDEIVAEIERAHTWTQASIELKLHHEKARGNTKEYRLKTQLRRETKALYSYSQFLEPKATARTAVIVIDYPDKEDIMYLFMPALGRVNTLSSKARRSAFMGTDLNLEDLNLYHSYQGTHRLLSQENGLYQIETTLKDHESYSRFISTVQQDSMDITAIQFFDTKGTASKNIQIQNRKDSVFPLEITIKDLHTKSNTTVNFLSVDTTTEIPMSRFSKDSLIQGQ